MTSDLDSAVLRLDSYGLTIPYWSEYVFTDSYMTPCSGFSFSIGDPSLPHVLEDAVSGVREIREGLKVGLMVNGVTILTGYIDEVHYSGSRGAGSVMTVSGRNCLGDAMDAVVDPTMVFDPKDSLSSIIKRVLEPYGFSNDPIADNDANRDVSTGNKYGYKVYKQPKSRSTGHRKSRGGTKSKAGTALKSFLEHQCKPRDHEGAYEFCERIANKQGLHIRCSGDGLDVIVGKPEYDQEARYTLLRRRGNENGKDNNVLSGTVNRSRKGQPSVIVAGGGGGGNNVDRSTLKVIITNWMTAINKDGTLIPGVQQVSDKYPSAYYVDLGDVLGDKPERMFPLILNPYPRSRPWFLYDSEARNLEQLKNFALREMAKIQKKALTVSYEVEGHTQDGTLWAVDTMVHVEDEVADLNEDLWVDSVTFSKSRTGGTRTHLSLVRPYTDVF